jgi:hypothetical protein
MAGSVMAVSRRWSVESKDFELVIKGGASGARIFERSNRKQRFVFLQKEELAWLARTAEDLVAVKNSEVFWDHSRAGYPRIIAQKCSNRHGYFLTIEEFDGRRRCGSILVSEGRYGQGWKRFISEVRRANSSLRGIQEVRECKKDKEVTGRRSYAELLRRSLQPVEDCFNSFPEAIARIPSWLEEASMERDIQDQEAGKHAAIMKKGCNTAKNSGVGAVVPAKRHAEEGGCNLKGGMSGAPASRVQTQASSSSFMARQYATKLGTEQLKGWEGADKLKGREGFDSASLELLNIKESLKRWKSEVDVGLERLEAVIKKLESDGLGLGFSGQQKSGLKGKEKMEVEGKDVRPVRSFKPKLTLGLKRKKPCPLVWRKRWMGESSSSQVYGSSEHARVAPLNLSEGPRVSGLVFTICVGFNLFSFGWGKRGELHFLICLYVICIILPQPLRNLFAVTFLFLRRWWFS